MMQSQNIGYRAGPNYTRPEQEPKAQQPKEQGRGTGQPNTSGAGQQASGQGNAAAPGSSGPDARPR
jgi:hypothetical protein